MALLRDYLQPTLGQPNAAILQPRKRRSRMQLPVEQEQPQQTQPQPQIIGGSQDQLPQRQFMGVGPQNIPKEQDLQEQFARISQGRVAPQLEPIARVTSPNAELVQPSNFQTYYGRLQAIQETNRSLEGAAAARAAFQRMQSMMSMGGGGHAGHSHGGGSVATGGVPSNPRENFRFAQNIAGNFGWNNPGELAAWYELGMKESGWRNTAQNPTSTAYGIGQFLNSTWAGVGIGKTSDPALQVEAMARYIRNRYGSPSAALAFHRRNNWY